MRLLLKLFAALFSLVFLTVAGAFIYLTQVLDPNDFKADIEGLASEQGVPLKLHGQVAWQFFPQLGLRVEDVELATPGASLLKAQELSAYVAVAPLLQGQVQVAGVLLKGTRVHALRGPNGQANWDFNQVQDAEAVSTAGAEVADSSGNTENSGTPANTATPANTTALTLAVERFVIEDAEVLVEDLQADTRNQLERWNMTALNINFDGQPFHLQQHFVVRLEGLPALRFDSQGEVRLDAKAGVLDLPSLAVTLATLDSPDEKIALTLTGRSALEPLTPDFHLSLAPVNAAAWLAALNIELPPMAAADALTQVALEADLSGADQAWRLSDIDLRFDKTRLRGALAMAADGALDINLKGDQLNVDRYLPPAATEPKPAVATGASQPAPTASAAPASPLLSDEPLPLAGLKALVLKAELALGQLQASGLTLTDAELRVAANAGDVQLEQLSVNLYDGRLGLAGRLDARQPVARVNAKGGLTDLSLAPLLTALALQGSEPAAGAEPAPTLAGQANIEFDLATRGKSLRDWQLGLTANADVLANRLTVHELDVEQGFCELAATLSGKTLADQTWKGLTNLEDVRVDLAVAGTEVSIKQVQAGVEHFQLKGRGESNYLEGDFDITAEALVSGQKDVARGCQLDDRWRNRELPLRCAGNFDSIGARTCGPDKDRVNDLLRDEAKARAKEKVKQQTDKLENKLKKKLGDDLGGKLFKGLFGR